MSAQARDPVPVAVLASGGGTNLQALIDHFDRDAGGAGGAARVALVVSDRPDAGALERASRAGIRTAVIAVKGRDAGDVGREMLAYFERDSIGIVALAGYLRLVPDEVVRRYRGRIVNIHPALLPAFGGAGYYGVRVHRAVIESGATVSGPTVHLVDEEYDSGRILAQWPVPVLADDTAEALAARVLDVEHTLYPLVIESLARRVRDGVEGGSGREGGGQVGFVAADRAPTPDEIRAALGL